MTKAKVGTISVVTRARRHFRFKAKQKRNLFRFDAKKVILSLVSHRCEKEAKLPHFRFEAK
jgi:hypothetical protein